MVKGCPNLRTLCYSLYNGCYDSVTDEYMEKLFKENDLSSLTAFFVEKCMLSISTFHLLMKKTPNLKYLGLLTEWVGLPKCCLQNCKRYIERNNLNIETESFVDQYYL